MGFADVGLENNAQHLPDLMHFRSLVDVMALCNFCILANVLDYNTYQFPLSKGAKPAAHELRLRTRFDYNALTPVQRRHFSYIRGIAINFMFWMDSRFSLTSKENTPEEESTIVGVWIIYLSRQVNTLLNYKQKAEEQSVRGIINCKAADVKRQLEYLFYDSDWVEGFSLGEEMADYDSFAFNDYNWRVVKAPHPLEFVGSFLPTFPVVLSSFLSAF